MQEKTKQPLVSIIVITYNSSKFVLETLESAKAQTYRNIELIVTDDNSTDETVDICKKWIDENAVQFVRATLVLSKSNTGIPANINRGVNLAKGFWIKCIAGDDVLAEDCIAELIYYINTQQEDIQILYSDLIRFYGNSIKNIEIKKFENAKFCSRESTADDQYQILLRSNRVSAATIIIRRDLLLSVNGFDERFNLLEDWPLWVKITYAGYKIYYLDKPLVYYRLHENNLSMSTNQNYLYHPVNKINIMFKEKELIPRLPFIERWGLKHDILGIKTCFFLGNNKKNPFTRFIYIVFNITNPFYNYLRIKKILTITNNILKLKYI
jgi:Glycosyltransferases, probably involved in cell wall biogenesis